MLLYLVCIALLGIPVMMSEVLLGRRGRSSPINTMTALAAEENKSRLWAGVGIMGMLTGFLILSYYSVIAGWGLAYVIKMGGGAFVDISSDASEAIFNGLVASPKQLLLWHTLFLVLTILVVAGGVKKGLETAVRLLMPALVILVLIVMIYAIFEGEFYAGFTFLFAADFSKLTDPEVVMKALGHAFFTLSLGMGAIMAYGAYLPGEVSIAKTSFQVAITDTVIAILAGLAIFPIVFANGMEPGQGPGLIFNTLPLAFGHMPGGVLFGTLFFILLVFAAWTSAISLLEPAVAWLVEKFSLSRLIATLFCGTIVWAVGLGTVFSFNLWGKVALLDGSFLEGKSFFDLVDYLAANIMLPLGGVLICLFVAWVMRESSRRDELKIRYESAYQMWQFLARYIAPAGVILVFLHVLGVFEKVF